MVPAARGQLNEAEYCVTFVMRSNPARDSTTFLPVFH